VCLHLLPLLLVLRRVGAIGAGQCKASKTGVMPASGIRGGGGQGQGIVVGLVVGLHLQGVAEGVRGQGNTERGGRLG